MTKAVYCLASNDEQARRIVDHLLSAGFSNEDISILYPDQSSHKNVHKGITTEKKTKAPEGGVTGATTGGILGGSLGLLAGIGALAIPGLGPFIAAGPLVAALSGSALGGSVGLLVGTLVGSGIPEYEAEKYASGLKNNNILLSVHTDNDGQIENAKAIMKKEGAKDISSTSEKTKGKY